MGPSSNPVLLWVANKSNHQMNGRKQESDGSEPTEPPKGCRGTGVLFGYRGTRRPAPRNKIGTFSSEVCHAAKPDQRDEHFPAKRKGCQGKASCSVCTAMALMSWAAAEANAVCWRPVVLLSAFRTCMVAAWAEAR